MKITLREIAKLLDGTFTGNGDTVIENIRPIDEAGVGDITFVTNRKYFKKIKTTKASAILVSPQVPANGRNLVVTADPYTGVGKLLALFYPQEQGFYGISPDAYIEKGAIVSDQATVFPRAYVSAGARIEKGAVIYPGVFVGQNAMVGEDSILYANVTVHHDCILGKRVILHSGAVIGGDGFGFASPGKSNFKIPQVGFVQIDDDVEIGSNTTIDRGTMGKTWIGRNVKIDNLVQIAHNVVVGENSVITSQVGISGSTNLGNSVIVGGQTGIVGHINIGNNVMIAAGSGIHKDIDSGQIVAGNTQLPHLQWLKVEACRAKLPEMRETIQELKRKIEFLEEKINNQGLRK